MLKIGDYVALKPNLILGRAYGTVKFVKYHVPYMHKVLKVHKVSSTSTVYCSYNGYPCECGTFSEPMLNIARFKEGDFVKVVYTIKDKQIPYIGKVSTIKSVEYKDGEFIYHIIDDCGVFDWQEHELESCTKDEDLEELSLILENNENRLQKQETPIRNGEGIKGSRVLGRLGKTSIRSRPLRNPQRVRGK